MIYTPNITSSKKIKIRTIKDNITDTYDVDETNKTVPLTRGSGEYRIQIYENVLGNKYKLLHEEFVLVSQQRETDFTLLENSHVKFTKEVNKIARNIFNSVEDKNDKTVASAISKWVRENIAYDFVKAATIHKEDIPDLDKVINDKLGICIDKACLFAAICRILGIKCKVCIGKVENNNMAVTHAWNRVLIDGQWKRVDTTTTQYKTKKHIVERYY